MRFFPLAIGTNATVLDPLGVLDDLDRYFTCHSCSDLNSIFAQDVRDGWLDQIVLSELGLGWYALAKGHFTLAYRRIATFDYDPVNGDDAEYSATSMATPFDCFIYWQHGIDPSLRDWRSPAGRGATRHRTDGVISTAAGGAIADFRHACLAKNDRGIISPHLMLLGAVFALLLALAPLVAASAWETGETETGL